MYQGLLHLHSLLRWIILVLLVVNIVRHFASVNKPFTASDKKLGLFLMIAAHSTLLLGLYQWFTGPWGLMNILDKGMGVVMKDSAQRFWAVEHLTGMIIAIVLITIGKGVAKKDLTDAVKHKRSAVLFLAALLIILATVPWPFREGIGRPWFPGM
ncbi:MAG: hypothetical protein K2Q21_00510 [Chitinophagaceae bacterium]|nr:hypothetical protein [Chitinophagaceae bacterium]